MPDYQGGRPRTWCSQRCRRTAYEERRAADNGAIAVKLDERVVEMKHDLDDCVSAVAGSPTACRGVLDALADAAHRGEIASDPRWDPSLRALVRLIDALTPSPGRR